MSLRGAQDLGACIVAGSAGYASPVVGFSGACGQAGLRLKPLRLSLVPPNPPDGPEAINGLILNRQLSMRQSKEVLSARKPSNREISPVFSRKSRNFSVASALRKKRALRSVRPLMYEDDLASSRAPVKGANRAPHWFFRVSRRRGRLAARSRSPGPMGTKGTRTRTRP